MSEPKFHKGDEVIWGTNQGTIEDGPFCPGVSYYEDPPGPKFDCFTYIVVFGGGAARLLGESALEGKVRWEACPGEHRRRPGAVPLAGGWERKVD